MFLYTTWINIFSRTIGKSNYEEFIALQQKLVNQEQWIIDGNSTKSFEMRYKRADICLYNMLKKGIEYTETGQDYYEKRYHERLGKSLARRAETLGFKIIEMNVNSTS